MDNVTNVVGLLVFAFLLPAGLLLLLERVRRSWAGAARPGIVTAAFPTATRSTSMLIIILAAIFFLRVELPPFAYPLVGIAPLLIFVNMWFGYVLLTPTHVRVRRAWFERERSLPLADLRVVTVGYAVRTPPIWVTDAEDAVHSLGHLTKAREFAVQLETAIRNARS
jgi:hypothetical protein